MSSIPELPAERTCKNCRWQGTNSRFARCYGCKGLGIRHWEESLGSLRARAEEIIAELTREHNEADAAWQAAQGRIAHICQLLGVDFCCEEPETCEQAIERRSGQLAAMQEALRVLSTMKCDTPGGCGNGALCESCWGRSYAEHVLASAAGKPDTKEDS